MTGINERLRPLTLGEILDRTAQLYRHNFLLFAGVAALPAGVLVAVFAGFGAIVGLFAAMAKQAVASSVLAVLLVLAIVLVALPAVIAATVLSQAGLTGTAIGTHLGQPLKIRAALKSVWPRFWRYLWLMILQAVFAVLIPAAIAGSGTFLLFFLASLTGGRTEIGAAPGIFIFLVILVTAVIVIYRMLGYSLAMAVCVAEDKTAWHSLNRSMKLSRSTRGRIFVMLLLIWALAMVLSLMAYIPIVIVIAIVAAMGRGAEYATVTLIVGEILNVLINFTVQTLIAPVYSTALVLFYYDQRIRTEGYDIEWMMTRAGLTEVETLPTLAQGGTAIESPVDPDTVKGL